MTLAPSSAIVRLNVGGKRFHTTRGTLLGGAPNFFHGLLAGHAIGMATLDEQGCVFIDRSPEHFPAVLQYLRTGHWHGPRAALDEARFYGIEVAEMKSATNEFLRSLVHAAKLDAVAPLRNEIAELLAGLAPLLGEGAADLGAVSDAPVVTVDVFPSREALTRHPALSLIDRDWLQFVLAQDGKIAEGLAAWRAAGRLTLHCDAYHKLFDNELLWPALVRYVDEVFKLTVSLVPRNKHHSALWLGQSDAGTLVVACVSDASVLPKGAWVTARLASGADERVRLIGPIMCVQVTWTT